MRIGGLNLIYTHVDAHTHTHAHTHTWLMWKKLFLLQYHRGRPPQQEVWVFGMVDTSQQPALGFMQIVQRRDAATLLPIIQAHINPGTEIQWAVYGNVGTLPGVAAHRTVNHSLEFVAADGTHTQHVEFM